MYLNNFQSRFQLSFPGSFSSSFSIPFSVSLSVSQSVACRVRERRSRSEPCWRDLTSRYGITRSSLAAPRTAHRHQVRAFHDMIGWKFGSYDPICSLKLTLKRETTEKIHYVSFFDQSKLSLISRLRFWSISLWTTFFEKDGTTCEDSRGEWTMNVIDSTFERLVLICFDAD